MIDSLVGLGAKALSCGARFSLVLAAGRVYSFGEGGSGQLGHGDSRTHGAPKLMAMPLAGAAAAGGSGGSGGSCADASVPSVVFIAAGYQHSLLLDGAGDAHACGCGASGQLGTGQDTDELTPRRLSTLRGLRLACAAGGEAHSAFCTHAGAVYTCGSNERGQVPATWTIEHGLASSLVWLSSLTLPLIDA